MLRFSSSVSFPISRWSLFGAFVRSTFKILSICQKHREKKNNENIMKIRQIGYRQNRFWLVLGVTLKQITVNT